MTTKAGLWIDHRKAIISTITDTGETMGLVISKVEKQLRRTGGSPLKGPFDVELVPSDNRRKRAFLGHLNMYYDAVIGVIHGAEMVFIFGPGEAKDELKKRLEKKNFGGQIEAVETADKMTEHQVSAKVRQHFGA